MKVAVVHNRSRDGIINRLGSRCPERYGKRTVKEVVTALTEHGNEVAVLEGDKTLLSNLEAFLSPITRHDPAPGLVFNMAYGLQGEARYTHVPAMLELAGVPYTGASPLGHSVSLDKPVAKRLFQTTGIPTPAFTVMGAPRPLPSGLSFPVVVKPRRESTSYGLAFVRDDEELENAVMAIVEAYGQEALVEQYIDGREICVALLGNNPVRVLPPVELFFGPRHLRLMTWDDKYHRRTDEPRKLCPAPLPEWIRSAVEELARATFEICHTRDYARVDVRVDAQGRPWVLEINSMASLGARGSYVRAARVAGYPFASLVNSIVDIALARYLRASEPTPAKPCDQAGLVSSRVASRPARSANARIASERCRFT